MRDALNTALSQVGMAALIAVAGLATLVLQKLAAYFKERTANVKAQGILDRLEQAAEKAVDDVKQTIVGKLGQNPQPSDWMAARDAAISKVKTMTSAVDLDSLKKIAGSDGTVEDIIATYVEAWVHRKKQEPAPAVKVEVANPATVDVSAVPAMRRDAGSVQLWLMLLLAAAGFAIACSGCGHLKDAYATLTIAERGATIAAERLPVISKNRLDDIVRTSTNKEDGDAKIDAWSKRADAAAQAIEATHKTVKLARKGVMDVKAGLAKPDDLDAWIAAALNGYRNLALLFATFGEQLPGGV